MPATTENSLGNNRFPRSVITMKRLLAFIIALLLCGSAFAGTYRCTYTYRGLIKRITVQAESSAEARRTVQDLFPGCYVTGAHRVK